MTYHMSGFSEEDWEKADMDRKQRLEEPQARTPCRVIELEDLKKIRDWVALVIRGRVSWPFAGTAAAEILEFLNDVCGLQGARDED